MTKAEAAHKSALAELGCMVCRRLGFGVGPVELHHLRAGQGWGKGDYRTLIPLCYWHHRGAEGVHGLGTKRFPVVHGVTESELLAEALALIGAT